MQPESITVAAPTRFALWACPFRPFFLATGAYAIVALGGWLAALFGGWPLPTTMAPMQWHSHEMLYGMVAAAIAGFLLTAMSNWTGTAPLSGRALQALFALWLVGRVAMWTAVWLPGWVVAVADLAFLLGVAVYAGRVIITAGNYRNLPLVAVVSVLWLANLLFHAGILSGDPELARRAQLATIFVIVLLIVIIGGRITPAFTRNWLLRRQADPERVRTYAVIEVTAISATALLVLMVLAGAPEALLAGTSLVAGVANAARVVGWSGWVAARDPLVWILHVGYAWIPIGLLLMAAATGFSLVADTVWLHVLGPGAMGVMIVGVMTRVAIGHTGRELVLPKPALAAYLLILLAALVRLATGLGVMPYQPGVLLTGAAWAGAFMVFLAVYLPILLRPRPDGRPG